MNFKNCFSVLGFLCIAFGTASGQSAVESGDAAVFDVAIKADETTGILHVDWYPNLNEHYFSVKITRGETVVAVKNVEGRTSAVFEDIDLQRSFDVSVTAYNADKSRIVGRSPGETWRKRPARERTLQKQGDTNQSRLKSLAATLQNIDSNNFPFIFSTLTVEGISSNSNLSKSNFTVYEDGRNQTNFFDVVPPNTSGNVRLLDFVFVIDNSGSMRPEQQEVIDNVKSFVDELGNRGIDVNLGLVRFGQDAQSGAPILVNNGIMTDDVDEFKKFLDQLTASGGIEPSLQAIATAAASFNFRPGSQRHFLLITDEDSDGGDFAETINLANANNIVVHTAVDCFNGNSQQDYCENSSIRGQTGGLLFDVVGPYKDILDKISDEVGNTYIVRYKTDNTTCDGVQRHLRIVIAENGASTEVNGYFIPCAGPVIVRTRDTKNLSSSPQAANRAVRIEARITDSQSPGIQGALLFYRLTGSTSYKNIALQPGANSIYGADIPAADVQQPGIDYYILATDGTTTAASPKVNPASLPHQISILPNKPPVISHAPVLQAPPNTPIDILAKAEDNTNNLASVQLLYRHVGTLIFHAVPMVVTTGSTYAATISEGVPEASELEYYIRATDDFGLSSIHGLHTIRPLFECIQSYQTDFQDRDISAFVSRNPSSWKVKTFSGNRKFVLDKANSKGDEYTIFSTFAFNDFALDLDAESDANDNYFIIFAVQDMGTGPVDSYYLQFQRGHVKLWHSDNINGSTLIKSVPKDYASDGKSHSIHVKRSGDRIQVWADGASVFDLKDGRIGKGYIGFGSFKGRATFDNFSVTGSGGNGTIVSENFENGKADGWIPGNSSRWEVASNEGSKRYFLNTTQYQENEDGLGEISIYDNQDFGDFTFECELKSVDAEKGNSFADLDIVFGYQNAKNYYYVMFNSEAGETAIYRLDNNVRTSIASYGGSTLKDGNYHKIKISRAGDEIAVYYNNAEIMKAVDNAFGRGRIGVGSFNDSGYFDNIVMTGDCKAPNSNVIALPKGIRRTVGDDVTVPVIVTTDEVIGVAQFTIEYDSDVLDFKSASVGQHASGFAVTQNNTNPPFPPTRPGLDKNVIVQISGGGSRTFTGVQQIVALLHFKSVGTKSEETEIYIDQDCSHTFLSTTAFKDLCGKDINFINGSVVLSRLSTISGRVTYSTTRRPVPNVRIDLTGAAQADDVTDNRGDYEFKNVSAGNYTLRPSKTGDLRNAVSGSDALAILQALGFFFTLSPEQKIAADVNSNGKITGSDAVAILRYLAFLPDGIAGTSKWKFVPNSKNITVAASLNQNFNAYLLGDVTLNWAQSGLVKSGAGGDFTFLPSVEETMVRIAVIADPVAGKLNTGTLSIKWAFENEKDVVFQPEKMDTRFAINNETRSTTHIAFANLQGFSKGDIIGTFIFSANPDQFNSSIIATLTKGTADDMPTTLRDVALNNTSSLPENYELFQNYPNPFNMRTAIKYAVPALDGTEQASIKIFSIRGRLVNILHDGPVEPGEHTVIWDGTDTSGRSVTTGIYIVQLISNNFSKSMKITVIK